MTAPCGIYIALSGTVSRSFFPRPPPPCGGMLCDDVGLGKSIQVLGLILSNPAPEGWAVEKLPARTNEPVPCKATLLVCSGAAAAAAVGAGD